MFSDNFQNQAFSFNFNSLESINSLEVVKDIQHLILLDYMEAGPDSLIQLLLIHEGLRALCLLIGPDTYRDCLWSPISAYIIIAYRGQAGTCVQMYSTYVQ